MSFIASSSSAARTVKVFVSLQLFALKLRDTGVTSVTCSSLPAPIAAAIRTVPDAGADPSLTANSPLAPSPNSSGIGVTTIVSSSGSVTVSAKSSVIPP